MRSRRFEAQRHARARMRQRQRRRMQGLARKRRDGLCGRRRRAAQRPAATTVDTIADQRMPQRLQMHAQLVRAARVRREPQQRGAGKPLHDLPGGERAAPAPAALKAAKKQTFSGSVAARVQSVKVGKSGMMPQP